MVQKPTRDVEPIIDDIFLLRSSVSLRNESNHIWLIPVTASTSFLHRRFSSKASLHQVGDRYPGIPSLKG